MVAVEGLGTTVLAAVTAATLLVESDCSTGDEQGKKKGRGATKKKRKSNFILRQISIFRSNTLFLQHKV